MIVFVSATCNGIYLVCYSEVIAKRKSLRSLFCLFRDMYALFCFLAYS